MKRKEVIEFLNKIETSFPVNKWKINNLHIWPYLRINIAFGNLDEYISNESKKSSDNEKFIEEPFIILLKSFRFKKIALQLFNLVTTRITKRIEKKKLDLFFANCAKQKNKILCFSLSHFRTTVDNKMYNRFMDPLLSYYEQKAMCFELDYNIFHKNKKKHHNDLHISIEPLLRTYCYQNANNHSIYNDSIYLKDYASFLNLLKEEGAPAFDISPYHIENLIKTFQRFFIITDFFKIILEKKSCKIVFITPYYGFDFFALCTACHELEVKTIDIQHGISDEFHFSYGNWKSVPVSGYEMLPDFFWTWTNDETENINKWAQATNKHRAFNGGNPWLQSWEKNNSLFKKENEIFNQLKNTVNNKKIILYSLESRKDYTDIIPNFMLEVLKKSPDNFFWLIRMHPNQLDKKESFIKYMKDQNLKISYNIELATQIPLPIILSNINLHTTLTSSVTLEAANYGIPTVLTDFNASTIYQKELENNIAIYTGNNPSNILNGIKTQLNNKTKQTNNFSTVSYQETAEKLLKEVN